MGINKYSFKFTPKASEDIREIFEYISLHLFNDIAAVRLMNAVETSITSTLLTLKLWIKSLKLHPSIRSCKLPVYTLLNTVSCNLPLSKFSS